MVHSINIFSSSNNDEVKNKLSCCQFEEGLLIYLENKKTVNCYGLTLFPALVDLQIMQGGTATVNLRFGTCTTPMSMEHCKPKQSLAVRGLRTRQKRI